MIYTGGFGNMIKEGIHQLTPYKSLVKGSLTNINSHQDVLALHNDSVLLCRVEANCFHLNQGIWKKHSKMNRVRNYTSSVVSTKSATYFFGGCGRDSYGRYFENRYSYEYLTQGSSTWILGKNEIPGGLKHGCAIAVKSEQEIWLIGGYDTEERILRFNVSDQSFEELPMKLNIGRWGHRCAYIPGTQNILITGGKDKQRILYNSDAGNVLASTEIIDIENESIKMSTSLKCNRALHGIGTVTINDEDRLIVFGGLSKSNANLSGVEVYDPQTQKWARTSKFKLYNSKNSFNFLTVKLENISGTI